MGKMDSRMKGKDIVIWGIGPLQSDLEEICSFQNILYYVDDDFQEENTISVSKDRVYSSKKLEDEKREDILVIICTDSQDDAVAKLKIMGYKEENYILGQELLADPSLYHEICKRKISIWGTGRMYSFNEDEIHQYVPEIAYFIVTEKQEDVFRGKEILSLQEIKDRGLNTYVIVASAYYKEIRKSLLDLDMRPGKDFIHLETFLSMCPLAKGIDGEFRFDDRKRDRENLLVVLAGYKEFVWDSVFQRLKAFVPENVDVCVVTSGLVNADLRQMCEACGWSYMSTTKNHVSLAVNLVISNHPKAKYVYKMDEDIFLTEGVFHVLKETYRRVQKESRYEVGFVTPLIPVNGYGYVRLLEIFGTAELWEERFGELKYTIALQHHRTIQRDPEAARFMWGEKNEAMSSLDEMQERLCKKEFQYSICPIRYSIGFILFHRDNWVRMGSFPVVARNLGIDEEALCKFCMMESRAMVVAENAVVGHLAYNPQNKEMKQYYDSHKEKFQLPIKDRGEQGRKSCDKVGQ